MLDKKAVRAIADKYADEVRKTMSPDAIILFGSYVDGNPHEWSDIDIAVIMNGFDGSWLETTTLLSSLTRRVSIIIEPHLLDVSSDRSGFVEHILKTGVVIYKAA
jgi:predicted nucleotidyltransferase